MCYSLETLQKTSCPHNFTYKYAHLLQFLLSFAAYNKFNDSRSHLKALTLSLI